MSKYGLISWKSKPNLSRTTIYTKTFNPIFSIWGENKPHWSAHLSSPNPLHLHCKQQERRTSARVSISSVRRSFEHASKNFVLADPYRAFLQPQRCAITTSSFLNATTPCVVWSHIVTLRVTTLTTYALESRNSGTLGSKRDNSARNASKGGFAWSTGKYTHHRADELYTR